TTRIHVAFARIRIVLVLIVEVVDGDTNLLQIVGALTARRSFARFLHRGQQQPDEHRDDGNNYQHLNEREAGTATTQTLLPVHFGEPPHEKQNNGSVVGRFTTKAAPGSREA